MRNATIHVVLVFIIALGQTSFAEVSFEQHIVKDNYAQTMTVYGKDIDADTDADIVGGAYGSNMVSWWRNDGDQNFTESVISDDFGGARCTYPIDLDLDGDIDILGAAFSADVVAWWENDGAENFTQHTLSGDFNGAHTVDAADLDEDNDLDVICSGWDNEGLQAAVKWWENADVNCDLWIEHTIIQGGANDKYPCVYAADIDGDADMDVLGALWTSSEIVWWENDEGHTFSQRHQIANGFYFVHWVHAADINGDGNIDIMGAACGAGIIAMWENNGDGKFTYREIGNGLLSTSCVCAADLDDDGDLDIMGTAENVNQIRWWENLGDCEFAEHYVTDDFGGASHVDAVDMDSDGDLDIVGAAGYDDQIAWWENSLYHFDFSAEPTSGHAPLQVQFTDGTNSCWQIASWRWDFDGDGVCDSNDQNPTWVYAQPGTYSVTLEMAGNNQTKIVTKQGYIRVFNGESALRFDGQNSLATVPSSPSLNLTGALTIEGWIRPSSWGEISGTGQGRVVDKGKWAVYLMGSSPGFNDHSMTVYLKLPGGPGVRCASPDSSIVLGEWQHVAVTYDGMSQVRMYINGVEQVVTSMTPPSGPIEDNSGYDLFIGNSASNAGTFDGMIDELRIWNRARTPEEIIRSKDHHLSGAEPGLVGCWEMNEGGGVAILDQTDNNHGVVDGALWDLGKDLDPASFDKNGRTAGPGELKLHGAFPNPFNVTTTIRFEAFNQLGATDQREPARLRVYEMSGRLIRTLIDGEVGAGDHYVVWNGENEDGDAIPAGVYLYRIENSGLAQTKTVVRVR